MPAFSRLQLAAALIEYDNDPDDPNPSRKAEDSAIFVRLRTRDPARARKLSGYDHHRVTPNHLGVQLPVNDAASARVSTSQRRSLLDTRASRGSVDLLRNPFGGDDIAESEAGGEQEQGSDEDPEVDLEAWGMTNFLGNKEDSSRSRQRMQQRERRRSRAQSEILPNPYSPDQSAPRPAFLQHNSKAKSLGGIGDNLESFTGLLVASEADFRRRTISAPLDPAGRITPDFQRPLSRGSPKLLPNRSALDQHPLAPSPNHIPFPTGTPEQERDEEPNMFELPLTAPTSRFDPKVSRLRTTSQGSINSQVKLNQDVNVSSDNSQDDIFAALSDRASRFDPGSLMDNIRPLSMASFGGTMGTLGIPGENNRSPSPGRTSHADMRMGHTRTISNVSLGSRLPPENEQELVEDAKHPRRFSRLDLLRPKLLIMPAPLQGTEEQADPPPVDVPAGFQLATLGPPLPNVAEPKPNSLTPNPRTSLTLSQLTFRNSLMNDGQRDVTFVDIERNLRRAEKDGEQIVQEEDIEGEIAQEQRQSHGRPAGKLYGRSLMDELQARKEKIKSKQRVFTGDQRPSMMSRGQVRRSGTLIDPSTLRERPSAQGQGQGQGQDEKTDLQRRPSKSKPLLNFDTDPRGNRPSGNDKSNNSVFGVDQLWERELQKLKLIEAAEKEQEEEDRLREAQKAAKKAKKKRKDGLAQSPAAEVVTPQPAQRMSVVPDLPPTLPDIPKTTARRAPRPVEDESESEADSEASARAAKENAAKIARMVSPSQGWLSSDEEGGHRKKQQTIAPMKLPSDSDEDLPLSTLAQVGALRPRLPTKNSDSEDEQPLSQVLQKKTVLSLPDFGVGHFNLNTAQTAPTRDEEEEEDDVPLAVRHPRGPSMFIQQQSHGEDDDDKPLALKQFETQQQQQAQYHNLLAQQQMMMMQPAMSMPFAAPSMMNGFSPFMMAPPPIYAPQPVLPDAAKFQSVDRWRHGVEN